MAHLGEAVHFCVYVPAPCLCWLTLGRSQEPLLQKQLNTTNRGHLTTDYTLQPTLEGNNALSSLAPTCGEFSSATNICQIIKGDITYVPAIQMEMEQLACQPHGNGFSMSTW